MSDLREAAEMALEALEWINRVNAMDYEYQRKAQKPTQALRQALAQEEVERLRAKKKQIYEDLKSEQTHNTKGELKYDPETGEPLIDGYPLYSGLPKGEEHMMDPSKINPIKIADFKAILEKLEAEGHTEIAEIILEWEYSCDELPDVDVKDGKVYMYFHDTWTEKKRKHDPRNA